MLSKIELTKISKKIPSPTIEDDGFDFTGYPKLGRPLGSKSGQLRNKFLKFYMSESELKENTKCIKRLSKAFNQNGFSFNYPEFFRLFLKFQEHPIILKLFMEDLHKNGFGDGTFKSSLN